MSVARCEVTRSLPESLKTQSRLFHNSADARYRDIFHLKMYTIGVWMGKESRVSCIMFFEEGIED